MPDLQEIMSVDDGFKGVISRLDPAQVPAQYVSQAVNRTFQDQLIKNRWGIVQPKWGGKWSTSTRNVTVTSNSQTTIVVSGTQIPNNTIICSDSSANSLVFPNGTRCLFDDNTNCVMSSAAISFATAPINSNIQFYSGTNAFTDILGVLPFRDPDTGYQALVVATNEARTLATEDGGQGRMYLVRPNQSDLEIPMNGHDIYSPVRLMQATNAVVMLRPGNARYYFTGADVNTTNDTVTLNVPPDMESGDRIEVVQVGVAPNLWTVASTTAGQGFAMFVNVKGGGVCTLHLAQGAAQTGSAPVALSSGLTSSNRYYFELSNNTTGYDVTQGVSDFYNDGLPLMMEASYNAGVPVSALDNGFNRIASVNAIVASSTTDDTITVPNHPFVAGDQVTISNVSAGVANGIYYVFPTDKNSLKLFSGSSEELDSLNTAAFPNITATIGRTTATATLTINGSGTITAVNITNAGAGYLSATAAVHANGGGGSAANITLTVANGKVTGYTIVNGGTGYSPSLATITITVPTTDGLTALTIVNQGAGYLTAPTLTLTAGAGTNASATAAIEDGKVTSVTIVNPGANYTAITVAASNPSTLKEITSDTVTGTIKKSSASGANVPAGREGLYFQNRLLLLYGPDYLAVSDVLDPLHYSPILNEFKLNTGANDAVVALYPFNATTLIIFKERSILAVENLYGDLSTTRLTEVTREFGCISQASIASTGSDIVFLSQRGVISLKQTEFGISQSVVLPLSDPIQDVIEEIDQANWEKSCGAYYNNRYILSVPVEGGDGTNQRTLVYNFLNQAWEGYWEGSLLVPRYYTRLVVAGTDTLCWADNSGFIHNFDYQALQDRNRVGTIQQIATSVYFRGHSGDKNPYSQANPTNNSVEHKQWTNLQFEFASWNPTYSITANFDGVNESYPVAINETKSRTAYYIYGSGTYVTNNSGNNFFDPYREDYSTLPGIRCNTAGFQAGLVQSFSQKARLRRHSITMQPVVTTTTGALNIYSVKSIAIPFRLYGKTDV
jgi:archaellum component FlaF (FlaF/FlaG flagellin family)